MIEYKVKVTDIKTEWFLNGKLHREDGPAVEYANGSKYWYLNGKLHREDGPAITYATGDKRWYLNNKEVTEDALPLPTKEMTMAELEATLGHKLKIIK